MSRNLAEFVVRVAEWQGFYAVLAGASATFAGLLFVSLSVNPRFLSTRHGPAVRRLSRHTFGCFIYLVLIALVVMIPHQVPLGMGIPLSVLGVMALIQSVGVLRSAWRDPDRRPIHERPLYALSTVTYAVLIGVSIALLQGLVVALYALVSLVIWQLAWATRLAWDLLILAAEDATAETTGDTRHE